MAVNNEILERLKTKNDTEGLTLSVNRASKIDAAREAELLRLSEQRNLPRDTVERNLSDIKSQERFDVVDPENIKKYNPKLAGWMTDPDNAAVAIDDVEVLAGFENSLKDSGRPWYELDIGKTFENFDDTVIEGLGQKLRGIGILGMDIASTGDMQAMKEMISPHIQDFSNMSLKENGKGSLLIPGPINNDLDKKSLELLKANSKLNFVGRAIYLNKSPRVDNGDGTVSTHKMSWGEVDGKNIVFPTIVQDKKGELKELSLDDAFDYALDTGEYIEAPDSKTADYLSREYKNILGYGKKGFEEKTYINKPSLNTLSPSMAISLESDKDKFMRESADRLFAEMKESDVRIQKLTPHDLSILEEGIRSGLESTAIQAPGMIASMVTGNPAFMLGPMIGMEYAGAYGEARAAGNTSQDASAYAGIHASIEYITEKIPADQLIKLTKGGKVKELAGKAGRYALSEIGGEQLATLGQSLNSYMFDLDADMAAAETLEERIDIQAKRQAVTLFAAITGSGVQGSVGLAAGSVNSLMHKHQDKQFNEIIEHVIEQQKIDDIISLSQSAVMKEHSPERMKDFVENEAGNGEKVFIPASVAKDLMEAGMELPPIMTSSLENQAVTGGDIEVSLGDFAIQLAPNEELMNELRPHLRMKADSLTPNELESQQDSSLENLLAEAQKNEDIKTESDEVFKQIEKQLIETGRLSQPFAKHSAIMIPSYIAVKSEKYGVPVKEIYEDFFNLKIKGPATVEDTAKFTVEDILGTETLSQTKVKVKASVAETGEQVTYEETAGAAIQDINERRELTERLVECLNS